MAGTELSELEEGNLEDMVQIVVLGAGGFGREVLWLLQSIAEKQQGLDILGFIDENTSVHGRKLCGVPILGGFEWFEKAEKANVRVACAVGDPEVKRRLVAKAQDSGIDFYPAMHPSCQMSRFVEVGEGTIIAAGSIITTQVEIGKFVTINLNCTIGHDVRIGDFSTLAPGVHISGNVILKEGVKLGTGAVVLPGVNVGEWTTVGAGAVVTKNIPPRVIAAGVPARVIRELG